MMASLAKGGLLLQLPDLEDLGLALFVVVPVEPVRDERLLPPGAGLTRLAASCMTKQGSAAGQDRPVPLHATWLTQHTLASASPMKWFTGASGAGPDGALLLAGACSTCWVSLVSRQL